MLWMRILIAVLALHLGGWFIFDSAHAFHTGDYVTPRSGKYAGQLGPWSRVVSAVGIPPRSAAMKLIFLVYGVIWVGVVGCYLAGLKWAWWAMLACASGALWYVPFGTLLGLIQIVLLLIPAGRLPTG